MYKPQNQQLSDAIQKAISLVPDGEAIKYVDGDNSAVAIQIHPSTDEHNIGFGVINIEIATVDEIATERVYHYGNGKLNKLVERPYHTL